MRYRSFSRRSLAIAAVSLVVAFVSILTATSILARPQWTAEAEPAASAQQSSTNNDSVSGSAGGTDRRSQGSSSSRGNRATELTAQEPTQPLPAQESGGKGPGLASPVPSSLESAAAAFVAHNSSGRTIRVGVQAGHWKNSELPDELASLRGSTGAAGSGWKEVDVNVDVSKKVAGLLSSFGIQVDLLPATVPVDYKADAFVAIHADANSNKAFTGFKIARATWSTIPLRDDALVSSLTVAYQAATGLPWHAKTVTDNMTEYYAFNHQLKHSVNASTPAAIVELGFLTNPADQKLMLTQPDRLAQSVALGILNFLAK